MDEIRKSARSPLNRVQSILEDSKYVLAVADTYQRPLVANMRCGLWYVPANRLQEKCYFKSTDGHTHQWQFSLKRLNLHLIKLIEENNGCIIVDSTRRGKLMPDALSKTVPIWCAVLNYVLLKIEPEQGLYLPKCVSPSERSQILALVHKFAASLTSTVSEFPVLTKKLRPIFQTQSSMLPLDNFQKDEEIVKGEHAVILCTASRQAQDGAEQMPGYVYVQGAGDDHELWAPPGFNAAMLWENPDLHDIGLGDTELVHRMQEVVKGSCTEEGSPKASDFVEVAPQIYIGSTDVSSSSSPKVVDFRPNAPKTDPPQNNQLVLPIPEGKRGSRELARHLHTICEFWEQDPQSDIVILSADGTDFAACVALMLNCRYFNANGVRLSNPQKYVSKEEVTRRNAKMIERTRVIPSRITQNVIGNFLRA